jgi:hypothetical protein
MVPNWQDYDSSHREEAGPPVGVPTPEGSPASSGLAAVPDGQTPSDDAPSGA